MLSKATVERLVIYNRVIKELKAEGKRWVTSSDIAGALSKTPAQVRRDISSLGRKGKRGVGYNIEKLIKDIDSQLGLNRKHSIVLIGAGNLGRALVGYPGFKREGFICELIVDNDPDKIGKKISGVEIESAKKLKKKISARDIDIAVITVPASEAQKVVDTVVEAGIKEILNFAPVTIDVPDDVDVRYVDLALEMENLSYLLKYRNRNK